MKKFFLICLVSCAMNAYDVKILEVSIPKTGTFLLGKYTRLLTNRNLLIPKDVENLDVIPQETCYTRNYIRNLQELNKLSNMATLDNFVISHLFHCRFYIDFLKQHNFKVIFLYRDPRDQVVSMAYYMLPGFTFWDKAQKITFDELIMDLITQGSTLNNLPPMVTGVKELYEKYLPWLNEPGVLALRFEDLIGTNGGGSVQAQLEALKKIAEHIGIDLSNNKLDQIINAPFGNGLTFREGKIGAWKKHFKQEHIKAFKVHAGDLLIKLGYEKDLNW